MTELSPSARAIVDAARDGDHLPGRTRERTRAAILATVAAPSAWIGTSGVAFGAKLGALAPKIALVAALLAPAGIIGALVVGHGPLHTRRSAPAATAASPVRVLPAASALPSPPIGVRAEPDRPTPVDAPPLAAPAHESRGAGSRSSNRPRLAETTAVTAPSAAQASAPRTTVLAEEVRLLTESRAALQRHQPVQALQILDDPRHPSGALFEERTVTRVLALCELGREAEARAESLRLLRAAPRSLHADRLRASCVGRDLPE
jgi:hypothetical protein